MQLTRAADYAIRVMIHLAGMPPGKRISRDDLASAAECPEQFLSKVLQGLTRAGLVISHRGNVGGFELPDVHLTATVLEVVEAIEGPIRLNICLMSSQACPRESWCPAHGIWEDAQAAMTNVLKAATIDELARRAAATRALTELPQAPQWN